MARIFGRGFPPSTQILDAGRRSDEQTVTLDALDLGLAIVAPQVNQQVQLGALALGLAVVAPQVNQQVQAPALDLGLAILAPQVNQQVQLPTLSSIAIVAPQINQQVQLAALALAPAIVAPQVNQQVQLGALDLGLAIVAPTVIGAQTVTLDAALSLGLAIVAPQINQQVQLAALALAPAIVAPQVNQQVQLGALALNPAIVAPQVNQQVQLAALALAPAIVAPTIVFSGQTVTLTALDLGLTVLAPQVNQQVQLAALPLTLGIVAPQINQQVQLGALALGPGIVAPTFLAAQTVVLSSLPLGLAILAPTFSITGAVTMRRIHDIQYHVVVFAPSATGGPGLAKYELDSDALNLVWQQAMNYPAQAAIGLARFNPKLSDLDYMRDHIKIFREDSKGLKTVFSGKIVKPNETARDSLIYAWDYASFLQLSRTGFRTLYPEKTIEEIVDAEWALAKGVDKSPFEFVATGTTEAPLALDGTTVIKVNSQFGVVDFDRLFLFFALAEMSMANTSNTVVFEITRDEPHTFNFWKNRSAQKTNYHFTFPGNLIDYDLEDGHDQIRNDLATIILDPTTGAQVEYSLTDTTSKDLYRRLQTAVAIKTLYGISSGTTETDQQKAALARMLTVGASIPSMYTLFPRQGEITPFDGWDLGDTMRLTIQRPDKGGDATDSYRRVTGIAGAWSPFAGELLQLFVR